MPRANDFPRTMQRGPLKGRRFATQADYMAALKETRNSRVKDEYRFHLRVTAGSLEIEVSGDPRTPEDVDKLLDLLAKFGGAR